jgi:hypothetical protein
MTALYIICFLALATMLLRRLSVGARNGLPSENGGFKIRGKKKWREEE